MASGNWGIGHHKHISKRYYEVICPVCGKTSDLTKRQYLNQTRFKCVTCQALRPIPEAFRKVKY